MKKKNKRILAALLACFLVVTILPSQVFAATNDYINDVTSEIFSEEYEGFPEEVQLIDDNSASSGYNESEALVPPNQITTMSTSFSHPNIILTDTWYYLKNNFSGKYLDVAGASTTVGANVAQWSYNGAYNQQWKIIHVSNGNYKLVSRVGSANRVLQLASNSSNNGTNFQIGSNGSTTDKLFGISRAPTGAFVLFTRQTGFTSCVAIQNASCDLRANAFQWKYGTTKNDQWIFEPVTLKYQGHGQAYAKAAYNKRNPAFPNFSQNCANFVSQCMLASGIHMRDEWYVDRKNDKYPSPSGDTQIDHSWTLRTMGGFLGFGASSPWISAPRFQDFWTPRVTDSSFTCSSVKSDPTQVYNANYGIGDVVQLLSGGKAWHTLYIVGYMTDSQTNRLTYQMASNTSDYADKSLVEIARNYPNDTFRFYKMI